jgi:hypothetical protein
MPSLVTYGSAIASTTIALEQLIESATSPVTTRTLDVARVGVSGPSVNLFLYRDQFVRYRSGNDPTRSVSILAELHYLVSAHGDDADTNLLSQRAYGSARAAIERHPILNVPNAPDGPMQVRLAATSLTLTDLTSIWLASSVPLRLSFGVTATFELAADDGPSPLASIADVIAQASPGRIVVFGGPDTTAKASAAAAVADGLGQRLVEVPIDRVVSKYIGETEKNLATVFDAAEEGGAVLFFDEADALFGRRTEVRDAHDRYANLDIGQVLDLLARAPGLVIIAVTETANDELAGRTGLWLHFPPEDR